MVEGAANLFQSGRRPSTPFSYLSSVRDPDRSFSAYDPTMSNPVVYKLHKDTDDGRTSRSISVSQDPNGKFALIVTDSYINNSPGSMTDEALQGRGVGETEVFPDIEIANDRAKEIYEENIHDGLVDGE